MTTVTTVTTDARPGVPDSGPGSPGRSSTTGPPVRVALVEAGRGAPPVLDGAWSPRSPSLGAELPALIADLQGRGLPISRVGYARDSWELAPRRLPAAGRTIRLGWFPGLDPHLVRLTGEGGQVRLDQLVIPPGADEAVATRAMAAASSRHNDAGPTSVLAGAAALPEPAARARTCPSCGSMPLRDGHCECGYADFDAANHLRAPRP